MISQQSAWQCSSDPRLLVTYLLHCHPSTWLRCQIHFNCQSTTNAQRGFWTDYAVKHHNIRTQPCTNTTTNCWQELQMSQLFPMIMIVVWVTRVDSSCSLLCYHAVQWTSNVRSMLIVVLSSSGFSIILPKHSRQLEVHSWRRNSIHSNDQSEICMTMFIGSTITSYLPAPLPSQHLTPLSNSLQLPRMSTLDLNSLMGGPISHASFPRHRFPMLAYC
jgi:hypothetical protein